MVFVPVYVLILFAVILIDYFSAFLIARNSGKKRKLFLGLSLVTNLGILCYFKYYNFFLENISTVLTPFHINNPLPFIEVILPIGLSFHTFQAMSYTLEVYRGNQKPEKHLGIYSLYVMFFPQLVAGPIERPQNLLSQLKEEHTYSKTNFRSGLLLITWGFFKKAVIADRLAEVVDSCYGNINAQSTSTMWLGVMFYSIQIYCDFSGYSDIAIGVAKTMGINLMENFKNPYLSSSITEFWRRWHISLSNWFRDYVYIPLGGSKVKAKRFCINILIVFALSGLWHGARYTFIIWGLIHALFLIGEHFLKEKKEAPTNFVTRLIKILYVFIITTLAWVFFRSQNIAEALSVFDKLFSGDIFVLPPIILNVNEFIFSLLLILILLSAENGMKTFTVLNSKKYYSVLWLLILVSYVFGIYNYKQFIYFQF